MEQFLKITRKSSNIRNGPGKDYTAVGIAYKGELFKVKRMVPDKSTSTMWCEIEWHDGPLDYSGAAWISTRNSKVLSA